MLLIGAGQALNAGVFYRLGSVGVFYGNRFGAEISPEVVPVRDAEGRIEVAGTMQAITSVVESWVREHPQQWLWLHRRWR